MKHVTTMVCVRTIIVLCTILSLLLPNMSTDGIDDEYITLPKGGLNILYTNAESLRGKTDLLSSDAEDCAILCLTETWLDDTIDDCTLLIPGYQPIVRHDRAKTDPGIINHGGVAVYLRTDIAFKHRLDLEENSVESVWVEISSLTGNFLLSVIYRPPSERAEYWTILENHIENARESSPLPVIICGDFNSNTLIRPCHIVPLLQRQGLHVVNNEATFFTPTSATCLDLFAVSQPKDVESVYTTSPSLSGHACLILCKNSKITKTNSYTRKVLNYKRTDWNAVNNSLSEPLTGQIEDDANLDEFADKWGTIFLRIVEKHTPTKIIKIRPEDKRWMNAEIRRLMKKRDIAYRKAKGKPREDIAWQRDKNLVRQKNEAVARAKKSRLDVLAEKINSGSTNQKTWWSLARGIYRPRNDTSEAPLEKDGKLISSAQERAEIFNKYFADMNNVEGGEEMVDTPVIRHPNAVGLDSLQWNSDDVVKAIRRMRTDSATGYDGISNLALQQTAQTISRQLAPLFNRCIQRGCMPLCWKRANVTPIHKKGSLNDFRNYRPISLLSCLSKVLERLVSDDLRDYLEKNNIITGAQYGFRKKSSTLDQLLDVYDKMMSGLDQRKVTKLLFLDVSKAFDRVWHNGLLHKLECLGVNGGVLEFFRSYLGDRYQRVALRGVLSSWLPLRAGVPQGSILGPLLFLVYSNDLVDEISSMVKLFADDTILGVTKDSATECVLALQQDILKVSDWARRWKVSLNCLKTKCLTVTRRTPEYAPLTMNGRLVEEVDYHCHLGLRLQSNGKWKHQVDHMLARASKRLAILKYYSRRFTRRPLLQLYLSYIRPLLEYGDYVWCNIHKHEEDALEAIQLSAMRSITGNKIGTSHFGLYRELDLPTLKTRRYSARMLKFFEVLNRDTDGRLNRSDFGTVEERNPYRTRYGNDLAIQTFHTELCRTSFRHQCIVDWNALPGSLRTIVEKSRLKLKLRPRPKPEAYYGFELTRWSGMLLSRLRCGNSDLNANLYRKSLVDSPMCECGETAETEIGRR